MAVSENHITDQFNKRLALHVLSGTFGQNPQRQLRNAMISSFRKGMSAQNDFSYSRILYTHSFDGQKNHGELGPAKSYLPNYVGLRARSWQSMLESEIAQIVIGKYIKWVIGKGLKLQSEPQKLVLQSEGVEMDVNKFTDMVEARFTVYAHSRYADHSSMRSLNIIASEVFKNSIVGGDVLCVLRYDDEYQIPTIQTIDGAHIESPMYGTESYAQVLANGNRIENGIELSPANEHVAYWVRQNNDAISWTRIEAKNKRTGLITAFLVYGMKYRLDNHRGIPLLAVVLETMKKLERYKEATVGSAEERQKIAFFIQHTLGSTGESPLFNNIAKAMTGGDDDANTDDLPQTVEGNQLADKVYASTNKQTFNMPINSELKSLESKNELYFKDFYTVNINLVCAALDIPPNVAMSLYDSNFSASRAALKDWEHSLMVARANFAFQFYQPVYRLWLHIQILSMKIQADGYITSFQRNQWMATEAFFIARFVGTNVPHIDPMKEVQAERLKLGDTAASIPLTTVEAATEALGGGDSDANMEQYADELKESKSLGIKLEVPKPAVPPAG